MFSSFFSKSAKPLMIAANIAVQAGIQVALKNNSPKAAKAAKAGLQSTPNFFNTPQTPNHEAAGPAAASPQASCKSAAAVYMARL